LSQPTGQYSSQEYTGPEYFAGPDPRGPYQGTHPPQQPGGWPGAPGGGQFTGGYPAGPVPGGYPPPGGPPDYLSGGFGAPPLPPRRRRRMLWAIVASVTAVVLTAGGVTAYSLLAGSGVTLDAQLPGDSVAYAEINLDPPAAQKVAALRFFHHFGDLNVREDAGDLLEGLLEPLLGTSAETKQLYNDNVKPWVGKRAAVAVDPQGSKSEPIAVIESTDSTKARAGLDVLRRRADGGFGYVIKDNLVVLGRSDAVAQAAITDAGRSSLHGNDTFQQDLKSIGDDGVFTAWVDVARSGQLGSLGGLPGAGSADVDKADLKGRVVASLRFTDSTADLVMRAIGTDQTLTGEAVGARLNTLPDDTATAVALSGGDKLVRQVYEQADKAGLSDQLSSLEKDIGISLPEDLAALVGSTTVLAIGGTSDHVDVGGISHTDDVDRAKTAAERLSNKLGVTDPIIVRPVADGTVIANSSGYADKLTAAGGLGNSDLFRAALPDLNGAQLAIYVDMLRTAKLGDSALTSPGTEVRAYGMTASTQGDTSTIHFRVVV
jgi:hypothetical protein